MTDRRVALVIAGCLALVVVFGVFVSWTIAAVMASAFGVGIVAGFVLAIGPKR